MRQAAIWCVAFFAMAPTAWSETKEPLKELAVDLGNNVKLEMVLIPAGSFIMGNDKGPSWEKPAHKVTITKPFYLGKYEVTQEQWAAVVGTVQHKFPGPKNPVESVSWDACQAFLAKLNEKVGGQVGKFALPTEAQWEYACRAGSATQYCFGNDDESKLREHAWYAANSWEKSHPVGEKKPNAWGLHDMHGNVWEWCADWYDEESYAKSPTEDPLGPATGTHRVRRGGGWYGGAGDCGSAIRNRTLPSTAYDILGVRVSLTPPAK